jgi:hypothetical protein
MQFFDDPFAVDGNSFYEWLRREQSHLLDAPALVAPVLVVEAA